MELQRCSELLTEEELGECGSSDDGAVRRERVLSRAHVRWVLSRYLPGTPHPRSLLFERNSHGKPHLLWPAATPAGHTLRFNLTHTPSLIGLAVTAEQLVGLDVEAVERRTRSDPMRLARRRFSDQEIADLEACPDPLSRGAYFLQLWTLKEAYVKALGRGISAPPGLRSFSFRLRRGTGELHGEQKEQAPDALPGAAAALLHLDEQTNGDSHASCHTSGSSSASSAGHTIQFSTTAPDPWCWQFSLLQPAPGHMAALCVECSGSREDNGTHNGSGAADDCSAEDGSTGSGGARAGLGMRVLHFQVQPGALAIGFGSAQAQPAEPQLIAQGMYLT